METISNFALPSLPSTDCWFWNGNSLGLPITKCVYQVLFNHTIPAAISWPGWKILWKLRISAKIKIFGWKLIHHKLQTLDFLAKRVYSVRIFVCCVNRMRNLVNIYFTLVLSLEIF